MASPLQLQPRDDSASPRPGRRRGERFNQDDFFGAQRTSTKDLPDPEILLTNLSRCVIEVLAGARELEQLSRWVSDEVYRHLLKRVVLALRARQATSRSAHRPQFTVGQPRVTGPADGVVEAVVMIHQRGRSRAVAIRLEGRDGRWRASAINVL